MMDRISVIKALYEAVGDKPIIFTTGYTCRDAYSLNDRKGNFYMVGSMGHASSIALGIALSKDIDVVVVDGDGSFLMNPSGVLLTGVLQLKRLVHIVLDNGVYESTGRQDTVSKDVDFVAIARAAGYKYCKEVENIEEFTDGLRSVLQSKCGPSFMRVKIDQLSEKTTPRIGIPLFELRSRFKRFIEDSIR